MSSSVFNRRPLDEPIVRIALNLAHDAHGWTPLKNSGASYFWHLNAVATRVARAGGSKAAIAAAYVHDIVEDCNVGFGELALHFSDVNYLDQKAVVDIVFDCTEPWAQRIGGQENNAQREALYSIGKPSWRARKSETIAGLASGLRNEESALVIAADKLDQLEDLLPRMRDGLKLRDFSKAGPDDQVVYFNNIAEIVCAKLELRRGNAAVLANSLRSAVNEFTELATPQILHEQPLRANSKSHQDVQLSPPTLGLN